MGVGLDATGGDDEAVGVHHGGVGPAAQARIHAVHHARVSSLADGHDASVANADVGLHDAGHRVDDGGVLHHHVQGARGVGAARVEALAVAHGLAGAGGQFVAVDGVVVLDLGQQRGVPQAHQVAGGGAVEIRVVGA
jgi:hypothetical protein